MSATISAVGVKKLDEVRVTVGKTRLLPGKGKMLKTPIVDSDTGKPLVICLNGELEFYVLDRYGSPKISVHLNEMNASLLEVFLSRVRRGVLCGLCSESRRFFDSRGVGFSSRGRSASDLRQRGPWDQESDDLPVQRLRGDGSRNQDSGNSRGSGEIQEWQGSFAVRLRDAFWYSEGSKLRLDLVLAEVSEAGLDVRGILAGFDRDE